ncbi:transcription regulator protein, response regulator containing CheY-like receiver domain and HTH DNA-binding domain [Legionella busanensis]|uniref:Transcription regulator protein, response regulator containing CheY-like receiver domain and HTH DNA-binding domain n=1 Tax=Legionella busanensis TaxID=190655 RepID=A0A378JI25_9GAMM|nr:helix-turn-helix transcriptional regulator [Legionella busanensis]STX50966.1 transcription regulator protein, response regulator containing CheY-like receiver domain and HTH DNA-binding domain [Legionella busanensis]
MANDKHISFVSCTEIQNICKPLIEHSLIRFFEYTRIYTNGSRTELSNNLPFLNHTFVRIKPFEQLYTPELIPVNQRYLLTTEWVENLQNPAKRILQDKIAHHQNILDIGNKLLIAERNNNYTEYFQFASSKHVRDINNYFLNHLDMFEQFKVYFKEKASFIINKAIQDPLIKPWRNNYLTKHNNHNDEILYVEKKSYFNKNYTINNLLNSKGDKIKLTKRELDCAYLLIRGKTYREIAVSLSLSPRSIESYIESIKNKTSCYKKSELIEWLLKNKLTLFDKN